MVRLALTLAGRSFFLSDRTLRGRGRLLLGASGRAKRHAGARAAPGLPGGVVYGACGVWAAVVQSEPI